MIIATGFDPGIASLDADTVYFPVRHHSPAAARLLEEAIVGVRPSAVLIEGPSDFNNSWRELLLPHEPPVAIYSYVALDDGTRSGAFYPFCVYSPEWHAIRTAADRGIPAEFIDLPFADSMPHKRQTHAYADGEERNAGYIAALVERLGLDSFDDLWDQFFEIDAAVTLEDYMLRCHELMFHVRLSAPVQAHDQRREAFMAARIAEARQTQGSPLLVVTGAYHSWALYTGAPAVEVEPALPITERGIALTPYSYPRLDALRGYEAGMPNPGFYHRVWTDRLTGRKDTFQSLLGEVATAVRGRKQPISAADLIAVEGMARGLATLRGQARPWRRELKDGVRGALIKDDLIRGYHPMLTAVDDVLRGDERGHLATGTRLPPLVGDIKASIRAHDLAFDKTGRQLELDLTQQSDLPRARVLHQLRGLGIAGYELLSGGRVTSRDDVTQVIETWHLAWSENFDSSCIERAVYGPTLADASRARLEEQAKTMELSAGRAAELLLEASLQGHMVLAASFQGDLTRLIREDADFHSVTNALNTLLYLYRYDDVLRVGNRATCAALLREAYQRGLWLLEAMAPASDCGPVGEGIGLLRETLERCGSSLALDPAEFIQIFQRLAANAVAAYMRGASAGVLWSLAAMASENITLPMTASPEDLGDFLHGLFALAREAVQRHPELVQRVDALLGGFDEDEFLQALPPLRLAFSQFTPREKHHIVETLLGKNATMPRLAVSVAEAARAHAWEGRVYRELLRHGVLTEQS